MSTDLKLERSMLSILSLTLIACSPDFVNREATFADDGEGVAVVEQEYAYDDGDALIPIGPGAAITSSPLGDSRLWLNGEPLPVTPPHGVTFGDFALQPRWMRSQGYLLLGGTIDVAPMTFVVDDATGEALWMPIAAGAIPSPDGRRIATRYFEYHTNNLVVYEHEARTGVLLVEARLDVGERPGCWNLGYRTDGRAQVTCHELTAVLDGTVLRTDLEPDPCASEVGTSSSAWDPRGRSVWEEVGPGTAGVRYDDLYRDARPRVCDYP